MAKGKVITEEKFNKIKALVNGGAAAKQIMAWEDVSEETVRRVKNAETHEQYKEYARIHHKKSTNDGIEAPEQIEMELAENDFRHELASLYMYSSMVTDALKRMINKIGGVE